ncbi:hypothetical protein SNE40_016016 [Patella caerulea]|uniref:Uncharacterized protein n=1 Tax=Patella caerulea TaxID=87958 RepID=A0AAN8PLZ8_PATCE
MGADHHPGQNNEDVLTVNGHRVWPAFDLYCPTQRPLYHVTRASPGNRKYPMVKMSMPSKWATKVGCDESVVNLDDVYNFVERKRISSSGKHRRKTVEMGRRSFQSQLEMSRPQSCISQFNKPRQSTNKPILLKRSTMDSIPIDALHDQHYRPRSVAESEISSSVQNHCCELMGPTICTSCSKRNTILINRAQNQSSFTNYKMTTENIATVTMVKRVLPHLSTREIQHKLDNGAISYPTSVHSKHADKYRTESETSDELHDEQVKIPPLDLFRLRCQEIKRKTTTPMFFNSIRQLNQKIVSGTVDKDIGRFCPIKKEIKRSESPFPVFVSPKKNSIQEPSYKAYFDPPLLEKENQTDPFAPSPHQNVEDDVMLKQQPKRLDSDSEDDFLHDYLSTARLDEGPEESTEKKPFDPPLLPKENQIEEPSFFAGSVIPYTLPERAPDKLGSCFDLSRIHGESTSSDSDNDA